MRTARLATLALALVLVAASPGHAGAAPAPAIDETDPHGDVRIFRHPDGLTDRDLRSVDLHRFRVGAGDEPGEVRITFSIRRVAPDFEQVLSVFLDPPRDYEGHYWSSWIDLSPQHPLRSTVLTYENSADRRCHHVPTTVRRGRDEVWIDVPATCLPDQRGRMKVWTLVSGYHRPSQVKSNDTLRVPGRHRIVDYATPSPG